MPDDCGTMTEMPPHRLEDQLTEQIEIRLIKLKLSKSELGRRVFPDATRPEATVGNYLRGRKGLVVGVLLKILDELGADSLEIKWKNDSE